jgi:hypothetical protein
MTRASREPAKFRAWMKSTFPPFLYKYRSGSERDIETLRARRIWVSSFEKLSDPDDGKLQISIERAKAIEFRMPLFGLERYGPPTEERTAKVRQIADSMMQRAREVGCYSLARTGTNQQMWDYYANGGAGFCIEFDWRFDADTVPLADPRTYAIPVDYVDAYPRLELADIWNWSQEKVGRLLLSTKDSRYKHEDEMRISYGPNGGDRLCDEPAPINAIIFGRNAASGTRDAVRSIFANTNVTFKTVRKVIGEFGLEIVDD